MAEYAAVTPRRRAARRQPRSVQAAGYWRWPGPALGGGRVQLAVLVARPSSGSGLGRNGV